MKPFFDALKRLYEEIIVWYRRQHITLGQMFGWGIAVLVLIYLTGFSYVALPVVVLFGLLSIAAAIQERSVVERDRVRAISMRATAERDMTTLLKSQITCIASPHTKEKAQKFVVNEAPPLLEEINDAGVSIPGGWEGSLPFRADSRVSLDFKFILVNPGSERLWKIVLTKTCAPDFHPTHLVIFFEPLNGNPFSEDLETGEPLAGRFDPRWAAYVKNPREDKMYSISLKVLVPKEESFLSALKAKTSLSS